MDTEEDIEIKKAMREGHSQTDEGPYYHESWWQSYKSSVKGKLGGLIIGAILGAGTGLTAAFILTLTVVNASAALPIIGAFAAAGMLYGAHEFSDIGKVVGSDAATARTLEKRLKGFIKKEISGLKNSLTGKPSAPENEVADESYRTQHSESHTGQGQWIFWNVAAIGAVIGIAAGLLINASGLEETILHHMGSLGGESLKNIAPFLTVAATGLFGASYGVNRDMFRQIFDRTDLLFKGIFKAPPAVEHTKSVAKPAPEITTIVYDSADECSKSDTYHRDFVMAQAKSALLGMDHTKARPN